MGIRRGEWKIEPINKLSTVKTARHGARSVALKKDGVSNSEYHMSNRGNSVYNESIPDGVSEYRKTELIRATGTQNDTSGPSPIIVYSNSYKRSQEIRESYGLSKTAGITVSDGNRLGASGSTIRQAPEVYSPLFQIANLQLPRDRITMNAWNRNFYDTHPLVHNCINLHATYPISKINIKCKDHKVEQFFKDMADEIDLVNILQSISLEFWKLGECLVPGTTITLGNGSVKKIENMSIGDTVITHYGNKKQVTDLKTHYVCDDIYEIEFVGSNQKIQITGNHPIWAIKKEKVLCNLPSRAKRGQKCWPIDECLSRVKYTTLDGNTKYTLRACKYGKKEWKYNWIKASDLSNGDMIMIPINTTINDDFSKSISKEWARLLGYFASEGCYYKNPDGKINGLIIATSDEEINKEIINLCSILRLKYRLKKQGATFENRNLGYDMYHIIITDKIFAEAFYEHCGEYSHTKTLSNSFMEARPDLQKEFLEAYINGDGSIDKKIGRLEIATNSQNMANQIRQICGRLGITSCLTKTNRFKTAGDYKKYTVTKPTFFIRIPFGQIVGKINNLISYKQDIINKISLKKSSRYMVYNEQIDGIATQIKSISKIKYSGPVFNLEIEDDHSYMANGMAVHNCFPYAELDENKGIWNNIIIQNPDYIHVKTSVLGGDPVISMRPDAALQRLVHSSNPADIQLRKQIDEEILYHVKRGNNIPLDNFHVSHLKMLTSSYGIHGTSPIVSIYKDLMLYDKLRECHSQDTEIITENGFRKGVDGVDLQLDNDGNVISAKVKPDLKIACFNPDTNQIEFHHPTNVHVSRYKGKMYHFNGNKVDVMVTPGHRMWIKKKKKNGWTDWHFELAKNISKAYYHRFKTQANWVGEKLEAVRILDSEIPTNKYMKFLGYLLSEGCVYKNYIYGERSDNRVVIGQETRSEYYDQMFRCVNGFANYLNLHCNNYTKIRGAGFNKHSPHKYWEGRITNKQLIDFYIKEVGDGNTCDSYNKRIPRWVLQLHQDHLKVLLDALVDGDGSRINSKYNKKTKQYRYSTVSKQLADDVYELVYKCGFVPNIHTIKRSDRDFTEYTILWSNTNYGEEPLVYGNPNHGGANIDQVDYDDLVWCYEVPTGLFMTRRNGLMTIQGNSKFAQADNLVNPITIVKVGGTAEGEYHPTSDDLEKWRQTFECHDEETEVLTDKGFRKYNEVMDWTRNKDGSYNANIKPGFKIACFNKDTEKLEYHVPLKSHLYDYDGEMYHFNGQQVDAMVTPNHRMFASRKLKNRWSDWELIKAKDMSKTNYKFRAVADFDGIEKESINVCNNQIKTDDYLEFLGNVISEGYVCIINNKYPNSINLYQEAGTEEHKLMEDNLIKIAKYFNKTVKSKIINSGSGFSEDKHKSMWKGILYDAKLVRHVFNEIGENGKCNSHNKRIPRWIYSISPRQIKILLNALIIGDGTIYINKNDTSGFKYSTISENLANDIFELAFLAGYSPSVYKTKNGQGKDYWITTWSDGAKGRFPAYRQNPESKCATLNKIKYDGKVWCFTVPGGLFVTKRHKSLIILGNSAQYDKDFKIISHAGISVERVGASGAIIDITPDMNFILDNILFGLMVPKAVVTQEGASFNSATVGLEVLKQRYESFRNMMAQWLTKKIFAPISEIQEFYEYKDGDKKLIVPEVEWNRMILFDMDNYINVLNNLAQNNKVSQTTLYRSLGLNMEEERRLIKEEMIHNAITAKEAVILQGMTLGALRAIKADEDIIEPTETPLPGTPGAEESGIPGAGITPGGLGGPMPGGLPPLGGPPVGAPSPLGGPPTGGPTGIGGPSIPGPGGGELGIKGPTTMPGGGTPPPIKP